MATLALIEDDEGVRDYFKSVVSRMGHELLVAEDGPSGLKMLSEHPADVILSDLNMPGDPNGMALIRQLRKDFPNKPIVVVSGYPTKDRLDECKEMGIEDFLTKPFEMTFFGSVVNRLLNETSE
jgi:two-component system response regulator (stage 0 sporulation protein F)